MPRSPTGRDEALEMTIARGPSAPLVGRWASTQLLSWVTPAVGVV